MAQEINSQKKITAILAGLFGLILLSQTALCATITVTSTANNGAGTLRQALLDANTGDIINFQNGNGDPFDPVLPGTITLSSKLPSINQGNITIDASNAGVILNGANTATDCITITSNSNIIMGMRIQNCTNNGIYISSGTANIIGGDNSIGSGSSGKGNVIVNNGGDGIQIKSNSNNIYGNYIGTDTSSLAGLGNTKHGIYILSNAQYNTIGGTIAGVRNIISGNTRDGIRLWSVDNNRVSGNYIGTSVDSNTALGNGDNGIYIASTSTNNTIGGNTTGDGNIISGNMSDGIRVTSGSSTIQGNYIGTNKSNTPIPNSGDGINIGGSTVNLGHFSEAQSNVIGPNTGYGIYLRHSSGILTLAGTIDVNDDIRISLGTLNMGAATVNLSGNWNHTSGTINADTSTLILDGNNQSISGTTAFYNLTKSVISADTLTFQSSKTTTITNGGTVTFNGTPGQLLTLASSSNSTNWNFVVTAGAIKIIDYINVSRSDASGSYSTHKPILPTNSNNGGNNIEWFGSNISVNKTNTLISDPVNGTGAGKNHIPGAIVEYTITTTNSGDSSPDTNSIIITDPVDSASVEYDVTTGISFTAYNSGLSLGTVTYAHKDTPTLYSYSPIGTYDPNVASIKIATNGTFNHTDTPDPRFTVTYRIRVQ